MPLLIMLSLIVVLGHFDRNDNDNTLSCFDRIVIEDNTLCYCGCTIIKGSISSFFWLYCRRR